MCHYSATAYEALHAGIGVHQVDLKTEPGRRILRQELAEAGALLTSFHGTLVRSDGFRIAASLRRCRPLLTLDKHQHEK